MGKGQAEQEQMQSASCVAESVSHLVSTNDLGNSRLDFCVESIREIVAWISPVKPVRFRDVELASKLAAIDQ